MEILFNVIGIILIFLIIWWFWMPPKASTIVQTNDQHIIDITVTGAGYAPNTIQAKANHLVILRFTREDPNPCSSHVVFADFEKSAELPVGQPIEIMLTPSQSGQFEFTCQMGMHRGKLIVTD